MQKEVIGHNFGAQSDFEQELSGVLTTKDMVRASVNHLLSLVLKTFYRLSKPVENEKD